PAAATTVEGGKIPREGPCDDRTHPSSHPLRRSLDRGRLRRHRRIFRLEPEHRPAGVRAVLSAAGPAVPAVSGALAADSAALSTGTAPRPAAVGPGLTRGRGDDRMEGSSSARADGAASQGSAFEEAPW